MSSFTGSLQSKKKSDLQEIALALDISESGTREELRDRIKVHLQQYESNLSEDPRFGGLYGRTRKRSIQPQMTAIKEDAGSVISEEEHEERVPARPTQRRGRQTTVQRSTPPPQNDSLVKVIQEIDPANMPLPASPIPSAVMQAASVIKHDASIIVQRVKEQERSMAKEGRRLLQKSQAFFSDASNIYTLTLLFELAVLLNAITPISIYYFLGDGPPIHDPGLQASTTQYGLTPIAIRYPHPSFFITSYFWLTLFKWSLPTLVIPQFFGVLISFTPAASPTRDIDPVTIGIMRVACSVASDFGLGEQVLARKWRVLSACVGAAFAFAEAIGERKMASLKVSGTRQAHA